MHDFRKNVSNAIVLNSFNIMASLVLVVHSSFPGLAKAGLVNIIKFRKQSIGRDLLTLLGLPMCPAHATFLFFQGPPTLLDFFGSNHLLDFFCYFSRPFLLSVGLGLQLLYLPMKFLQIRVHTSCLPQDHQLWLSLSRDTTHHVTTWVQLSCYRWPLVDFPRLQVSYFPSGIFWLLLMEAGDGLFPLIHLLAPIIIVSWDYVFFIVAAFQEAFYCHILSHSAAPSSPFRCLVPLFSPDKSVVSPFISLSTSCTPPSSLVPGSLSTAYLFLFAHGQMISLLFLHIHVFIFITA